MLLLILQRYEFSSKSQHVKTIRARTTCCCWYYKGTNFQANHNSRHKGLKVKSVVADTTKVRIFKQITTVSHSVLVLVLLLLILQRYEFSSKSQHNLDILYKSLRCCWYYKGTNFQANHNNVPTFDLLELVVADTTKVRIFKQITTVMQWWMLVLKLLLILQRYEFSSKSQHVI